jgi:signal transduction histidine kinase
MDKLMHPIGMWCKRGAWVILVIGVLDIVVGIYIAIQQTGASGGAPLSFMIADVLQVVLSIVPTFIFYSLILYAVGVIIDRFLVNMVGNSMKAKAGGVMLDEVEEKTIEPAMMDAQEIGDLRQDKVEDVIPLSTTVEAVEEESNVTQDKIEDVIPPLTMVEAAEEESDVTLTSEEASPIKPTTVESNGKNSDMKLARRRRRK